jgi:hypothetical protein
MFTIRKGWHFSLPRRPSFFVSNVFAWGRFTEDTTYVLEGADQHDWNKLTGISFNPFKPNQNAIMVAWRYDVERNIFQIAPYFNANGNKILPKEEEIVDVKIAQNFAVFVSNHYVVMYLEERYRKFSCNVFKVPKELETTKGISFRVQPYFGGNKKSPTVIKLELLFKKNTIRQLLILKTMII